MYGIKLPYLVSREWIGSCSIGLVKSKGGDVCGKSVGGISERAQGRALPKYP